MSAGGEWGWGPPKRPAPVLMLMGVVSRRRAQSAVLPTCKGQLHQERKQAKGKRKVTAESLWGPGGRVRISVGTCKFLIVD